MIIAALFGGGDRDISRAPTVVSSCNKKTRIWGLTQGILKEALFNLYEKRPLCIYFGWFLDPNSLFDDFLLNKLTAYHGFSKELVTASF